MNPSSQAVIKASVCPLDCPDCCSLQVTVQDQQIKKVRGSTANPYTAGVICSKVAKYFPNFVHGEQRLTKPLIRSTAGDGKFLPISWDEALDIITQKTQAVIQKYGAQSVLPFNYAGPHGQISGGSMDRRFFYKMGASLLDRGPLCGGVRGRAYTSLFGDTSGMDPEQAEDADLIAVWGNNVTVSNLHLARVIKQAREKGAKLLVIDPKRTRIAEQAHLYVQIAPGTDVVLAQALAGEFERRGLLKQDFIKNWVVGFDQYMQQARSYSLQQAGDICKISTQQIESVLAFYSNAKNLALSVGNGIERGKSGGSSLRAIMSLSVLLGQFGRRGAGVIAKPGFAYPATEDRLHRPELIPEGTRLLNIVDIGRHLLKDDLDPPIRAAFIYNHNPMATHPDQNRMKAALSRKQIFKVGIEVVMTDSMQFCDIILPASSHFEYDDIYSAYGHSYLQRGEAIIPCIGESLPNTEIFRRLAKSFGYNEPMFKATDQELMDDAFDGNDSRLQGFRPSEIPTGRALMMKTKDHQEMIMCYTVTPNTPSGKIELFCQDLEDKFGFGVARYQSVDKKRAFTIITPSSSKRTNSTFGAELNNGEAELVEINPIDASRHGISAGDLIKLENDLGAVTLKASITDAVALGVLYSPKGTWLSSSATGQTVNALIDAEMKTDIVGGACYNETFVDIVKV